jgi:hypothetical protein
MAIFIYNYDQKWQKSDRIDTPLIKLMNKISTNDLPNLGVAQKVESTL